MLKKNILSKNITSPIKEEDGIMRICIKKTKTIGWAKSD
jgi:hypothetical protein